MDYGEHFNSLFRRKVKKKNHKLFENWEESKWTTGTKLSQELKKNVYTEVLETTANLFLKFIYIVYAL